MAGDATNRREQKRAERAAAAEKRAALQQRKKDEKQVAEAATAAGLRHYESDYVALKTTMMAKAALKGIANQWYAKGFRVAMMTEQSGYLVLLLEHIHCDCDEIMKEIPQSE